MNQPEFTREELGLLAIAANNMFHQEHKNANKKGDTISKQQSIEVLPKIKELCTKLEPFF